jgi:HlyD family secretion protein
LHCQSEGKEDFVDFWRRTLMRRIVIFLILVALIGGGWFAFTRYQQINQATASSNFQTVSAGRGDLTATVGATGTVRVNQTVILTWRTSGIVGQVPVEVGDSVSSGQALAELEQTSLPQNVILASVDLVNAQQALDDLLEPPSDLDLSQAEQAIAKAKEKVRDTERTLANLESSAPQADIDQARSNVVLAQNKLDQAKKKFEPYENKPEDNLIRASLQSQVAQAQKEYDAAVRLLNNLLGTANNLDLEVAQSDLELAKAQLNDAQDAYDQLIEGPKEDDVTAAKARIAAAQATLDMASISAPFGGTITEVNIKPGDEVSPGSVAFRIDDLSHLLVDVQVSEIDINRIKLGQEVNLTFDAIPTKEYNGEVLEVALVGNSNQGVVDFTVTVELTDADEAVKAAMTAAVNIVVEQLKDVLLVPNRAVRIRDGQRVVYLLKNGAPEPTAVNLGASSDTMSQVIDGDLQVGDEIILNPPLVFDQSGPPGFIQR